MHPRTIVFVVLVLLAIVIVGLTLLGLSGRRAPRLGVSSGQLAPCPDRPNCVNSQATSEAARIAPLDYEGSARAALDRLAEVLESLPRTEVVARDGDYIRAEAVSRWFRFVDDLEFVVDPQRAVIHVRSASRVGYSDLGANRARVERIRAAFAAD